MGWVLLHALPLILYLLGISTSIADIADEYELEVGRRQEVVLFAAVSFAGKCMVALGSLLAGLMLTLISWPTGEAIKTSQTFRRIPFFHLPSCLDLLQPYWLFLAFFD